MIWSCDSIETECSRLGHKLGWRFLTCPKGNIESASIALIAINPGGDKYLPPMWSVENGSAYVVETWKDRADGMERLQIQVQQMFQTIPVAPENILSGYLVPFRSKDWKSLENKQASLEFGLELWREVFRQAEKIETVIAFGKQMTPHMSKLLNANAKPKAEFHVGWGEQKIDLYECAGQRRLIVVPHLSRYAIFGRLGNVAEKAFLEALSYQ
jgi:hypothetical protein